MQSLIYTLFQIAVVSILLMTLLINTYIILGGYLDRGSNIAIHLNTIKDEINTIFIKTYDFCTSNIYLTLTIFMTIYSMAFFLIVDLMILIFILVANYYGNY